MKGVLTSYLVNGTLYGSYILGDEITRIKKVVCQRGLNETIESQIGDVQPIEDYSLLNDEEFKKRLPEILHTTCFLSLVALKAKTVNIEDILGDEGIIHEITHYLADIDGCHKKSLSCIRDFIFALQKKAIGLYEPV